MSDSSTPRAQDRSREAPPLVDSTLDLLSNHRRRTILRVLLEQEDDRIAFSDLATELVARGGGESAVDRDMVIIDLHHKQLPRLVDAGVAEYDHRTGTVRYCGNDELETLLREHPP